jgi:GGDEF domain-containing protein
MERLTRYLIRPFAHVVSFIRGDRGADTREPEGVHSREQFREILQRELMRSGRSGIPFSILLFNIPEGKPGKRFFEKLEKLIAGRVRATDVIGWYSNTELGVLLPDTHLEGAYLLAEQICDRMKNSFLSFEAHAYPEEGGSDEDRESFKGSSAGHPPESHSRQTDRRVRLSADEEMLVSPVSFWKRVLEEMDQRQET